MCPNAVFFPEIAITQMRCWLEGRYLSVCLHVTSVEVRLCVRTSAILPVSLGPTLVRPTSPIVLQCGAVSQTPLGTRRQHLQKYPPTAQRSTTALSSLTGTK